MRRRCPTARPAARALRGRNGVRTQVPPTTNLISRDISDGLLVLSVSDTDCEQCPTGSFAAEAAPTCDTCIAGEADIDADPATQDHIQPPPYHDYQKHISLNIGCDCRPCVGCPPGSYAPASAVSCTDCSVVVFDGNATLSEHQVYVWDPVNSYAAIGWDKDGDPRTPCHPLIPEPEPEPEPSPEPVSTQAIPTTICFHGCIWQVAYDHRSRSRSLAMGTTGGCTPIET